jgi:hypothetical protein
LLIQDTQAFTALQTINDILVNNPMASNFERPLIVRMGGTQSAAGIRLDLNIGLRQVFQNISPSTANRYPILPDDYIAEFGVLPGQRIILKGAETSNNARTLFYTLQFRAVR